MSLTAEQRRVLNAIKRIGRQVGATPMEVKAAIETGLVEANLTNPSHGDRDSLGWRQERASLYPDPMNLEASIRRFYSETRALRGKYGRAGDLAAAVQRPAAQYRGRYQQQSARAQQLIDGMPAMRGAAPAQAQAPPATPDGATRQELLQRYVLDRGRPEALTQLGGGLASLRSQPPVAAATRDASHAPAATGARSPLLELFWNGPGSVNVKNGQPQPRGFVPGHTDHVHVAAGPRTILQLAKIAARMGLRVGENPAFGGVAPVHSPTSYHDRSASVGGRRVGQAIDVTGTPAQMRAYARRVARLYGLR